MELIDYLAEYGADRDRIVRLDQPTASSLAYADLLKQKDRPAAVVLDPLAAPVAYIIDLRERPNVGAAEIQRWRHDLALRGQAAQLVVVRPGQLDVYEIALNAKQNDDPRTVAHDSAEAPQLFAQLTLPAPAAARTQAPPDIRKRLLDLTTEAIDALRGKRDSTLAHALSITDAIALVGRAVFLRFLFDRRIATAADLSSIHRTLTADTELFDAPEQAVASCIWLDRTFNGDLLPLSFPLDTAEFAKRLDAQGWLALGNILRRAPAGQLDLSLDWAGLDFSRIPAGILSQLYEQQAATWDPKGRKETSIYYTPAPIADLMVCSVLSALEPIEGRFRDQSKVLDPAVGGGVFLVSALREILRQRWERTGERPRTAEIRQVLEDQLFGLDINESALRLSALSLYLAALEFDPDPQPLSALRFGQLVGKNLIHVGCGKSDVASAGSLGPNAPAEFAGRFDVVVGNPPWTVAKLNEQTTVRVLEVLRPIVRERILDGADDFTLPDGNPDLAFAWRSLHWCRSGGRIALVTHARLWLKQSELGIQARTRLLQAAEWTSVINGAALRQTPVWPNVVAPFAIWFGINRPQPPHASMFHAVAVADAATNKQGRFRIDPKSSRPLRIGLLAERPWLPKALLRGTGLDAALLSRLESNTRLIPFAEHWDQAVGRDYRGQGYKVASKQKQQDATAMLNLPNLSTGGPKLHLRHPVVDAAKLSPFRRSTLTRTRDPRIYSGPLLLVRKALPVRQESPSAFVCYSEQLVYTESLYGFSAATHSEGTALVSYLQLLLAGPLFPWFALVTSAQYGVERDLIHLEDLERLPIPGFQDMTPEQADAARWLSADYHKNPSGFAKRPEYLNWLSDLYDLEPGDLDTVLDSLSTAAPGTAKRAQEPATAKQRGEFGKALAGYVRSVFGLELPVRVDSAPTTAWRTIQIGKAKADSALLADIVREADRTGASQVVWVTPGGAVVAVLDQYRYWTRTRARLLALELFERDDFEPGV